MDINFNAHFFQAVESELSAKDDMSFYKDRDSDDGEKYAKEENSSCCDQFSKASQNGDVFPVDSRKSRIEADDTSSKDSKASLQSSIEKPKVSAEEYDYFKKLAFFASNKNANTSQMYCDLHLIYRQMHRNLQISSAFFFSSLQWKHVLYQTVQKLMEEQKDVSNDKGLDVDNDSNTDPRKQANSLLEDSEYVEAVFEKLSTHLLDLFSCLLCQITGDRRFQEIISLQRKLSRLYKRSIKKDTSYLHKRRNSKKMDQLLLQISELSQRVETITEKDILRSSKEANWPSFIVEKARGRFELEIGAEH